MRAIILLLTAFAALELHYYVQPKMPDALCEYDAKISAIALSLGANQSDLQKVIAFESGHNPQAVNPRTGATGLIQFMPTTAASLGTSTQELAAMTATTQLDYVAQYLQPYAGRVYTLDRLYLAVFFPAAIDADSTFVLQAKGLSPSRVANYNKVFDLNKDGRIQRYEVVQYIKRYYE